MVTRLISLPELPNYRKTSVSKWLIFLYSAHVAILLLLVVLF
jgi:hypothetical protein